MLFLDADLGVLGSGSANMRFGSKIYSGNSGTQVITNNVNNDLIWIKVDDVGTHRITDAVRGVDKSLQPNLTTIEAASSGVTALDIGNFTVDGGTVNDAGKSYNSFAWNESQNFLDIVTFSGTEPTPQTVNHNLGAEPKMMIFKSRDQAAGWWVYHTSLGATKYMFLNTNSTPSTSSAAFNNTAPTSTQFTVGNSTANAGDMVAYLFGEVAGLSSFGTYTGTGTTTIQDIDCGFTPSLAIVKSVDGSEWFMMMSNGKTVYANTTDSSFNSALHRANLSATGFSVGTGGNNDRGDLNTLGTQYIYAAWKGV